MVNIIVYLDNKSNPQKFVDYVLKERLAASASIDIDNSYFVLVEGEIVKTEHAVITLQTKALLFNSVVDYVISMYGDDTPVFSVPITQTNKYFDQFIRENTKKI
jgi:uncharacterized protein involved in tolerance to divalent cations